MKYNHDSLLPLGAFQPMLGRMRLFGGGGGFLDDVVGIDSNNSGIGGIVGGVSDAVHDVGESTGINDVADKVAPLAAAVALAYATGYIDPSMFATLGAEGATTLAGDAFLPGALAGELGVGTVASGAGAAGLAGDAFLPGALSGAGVAGDAFLPGALSGAGVAGDAFLPGALAGDVASGFSLPPGTSSLVKNGIKALTGGGGSGKSSGGIGDFLNSSLIGDLSGAGALAGLGGVAGIMALINNDNKRYGVPGVQKSALETQMQAGPKFNPALFQASVPQRMARGGMAMGGQPGQMYPQSMQEHTNFAQSTQYPTSAQQVSSYEPILNPLTGNLDAQSMAGGGISGLGYNLGGYSDGGRLLKGPGDGMSDNIPASIGHKQPARLADGEFVVPADVVSGLGNGSTDAGARHLYAMMDKVRQARTGTKKQGKQIKSQKYLPA